METSWKTVFLYFLGIFLGVNVLVIDAWIFTQTHEPSQLSSIKQATVIPSPPQTPTPSLSQTPTPSPTIAPPPPIIIRTNPSVKEFFIPLGSGQTDATDWTDIPGAQGYVDSTAYPNLKQAVIETTVDIPNGNETAWIRLYDKTDNHPVWFSEISWSGGNTQYITSQPMVLDSGNKLYQVQVKNQLPSMALVNTARIHITVK